MLLVHFKNNQSKLQPFCVHRETQTEGSSSENFFFFLLDEFWGFLGSSEIALSVYVSYFISNYLEHSRNYLL